MKRESRLSWMRKCRNPYCQEFICLGRLTRLCPSCRLAALAGLPMGAVFGALLFRWLTS